MNGADKLRRLPLFPTHLFPTILFPTDQRLTIFRVFSPSASENSLVHIFPGKPTPLGASWEGQGVNFALFSEHATKVELLLFARKENPAPTEVFELPEKTGPIWHGYLSDVEPGLLYGYRVHGPYEPENGHRFNANKVLLDPYARAIGRTPIWHDSVDDRSH